MKLILCAAAVAAFSAFATPAFAADGGPVACTQNGATIPPNLAGTWNPRQRDDGGDWHDIASPIFSANGTWTETTDTGVRYGHWCVYENVLIYGFDDLEHTTYRIPLGPLPMRGAMSWDGGGTGEIELRR